MDVDAAPAMDAVSTVDADAAPAMAAVSTADADAASAMAAVLTADADAAPTMAAVSTADADVDAVTQQPAVRSAPATVRDSRTVIRTALQTVYAPICLCLLMDLALQSPTPVPAAAMPAVTQTANHTIPGEWKSFQSPGIFLNFEPSLNIRILTKIDYPCFYWDSVLQLITYQVNLRRITTMSLFRKKQDNNERTKASVEPVSPLAAPAESADNSRNLCYKQLERLFMPENNSKGVVLKLYIENFKRLNDVFGYNYCEELLKQIIHYLEETTGSVVYRYIGVEFIIILDRFTQGQASQLADEVLERFDSVWKIDNTDCLCSVQIGLCSYPGHPASASELLKYLDLAIAQASEHGPNQSAVFDTALHNKYIRKQTIAMYLSTALENNEIEVRYRPTYHIGRKRFTRAEYYMRIFIKGLGLIGAAEFLPIAEDSGQIRTVEYFALDHVGACIADLINAGKEFESIALPISSVLFLQEDFLDEVTHIIEKYQIPKGKLALEIQESALTTAFLNINIMMQQLSEMGVELILNDFGSGYSGISNILDMPVNTLKLERMFVWQLETNPKSAHIINGLVQIAKHLELNIIAEGVETENQISQLTSFGCDYQQGFYYSPTLSQEVLMNIMDTSLEESRQILNEEKEKMK